MPTFTLNAAIFTWSDDILQDYCFHYFPQIATDLSWGFICKCCLQAKLDFHASLHASITICHLTTKTKTSAEFSIVLPCKCCKTKSLFWLKNYHAWFRGQREGQDCREYAITKPLAARWKPQHDQSLVMGTKWSKSNASGKLAAVVKEFVGGKGPCLCLGESCFWQGSTRGRLQTSLFNSKLHGANVRKSQQKQVIK